MCVLVYARVHSRMRTHVHELQRPLWFISMTLSITDSEVPQTLG